MVVWKKHHARVRMKREQHTLSIHLFGNFIQSVNDFSVPNMYAIKRTGGNNCTLYFLKFSYGMKNLQCCVLSWQKYSNMLPLNEDGKGFKKRDDYR